MKTLVYVDGFNLYFGALRSTPYKWLDVWEAVRMHLASHHRIVGLKYYTARMQPRANDPDQPLRQGLYLRALSTRPGTEIFFGHFLKKMIRMPLAHPPPGGPATVEVIKTEEKGSDVNLATKSEASNVSFLTHPVVAEESHSRDVDVPSALYTVTVSM